MSVLDAPLGRPAVLDIGSHRRILPFYNSFNRSHSFCCNAKISVDDDEQKDESGHKGFSIRVPTIPKLADIESARRMLESAFQSLPFDMPRIPIDSALQGLTFDIFKLPIPRQGLVFDITGFVATKLRKPPKHPENVAGLNSKVGLDERSGLPSSQMGKALLEAPVGPHCAWPRKTHQVVNADRAVSCQSISSNVLYPRSAWPRNSLSCNSVVLDGPQATVECNMGSVAKEEVFPCIIEGGARCAWPRKAISAKRGCHADKFTKSSSEVLCTDGLKGQKNAEDGNLSSANSDGAAELPRRMLATSVGLSVMNQLTKNTFATPLFDFCSLLPAGNLEFAEEDDAVLAVGRRTLLIFINKHSSG